MGGGGTCNLNLRWSAGLPHRSRMHTKVLSVTVSPLYLPDATVPQSSNHYRVLSACFQLL